MRQFIILIIFSAGLFLLSCEKNEIPTPVQEDNEPENTSDTIFFTVEGVKVDNGLVSNITQETAEINGTFKNIAPSTYPITEHGHVWSKSQQLPTLENSDGNTQLGDRSSKGQFQSKLSNLDSGTKYYVRTYVSSNEKVGYHPRTITFNTLEKMIPEVNLSIVNIGTTMVSLRGEITNDGGNPILDYGVVWSYTDESPTTSNNDGIESNSNGSLGFFFSEINNLQSNSAINFRAFATNEIGTSYSKNIEISLESTSSPFVELVIQPENIGINSVIINGLITGDGGGTISNHGIIWSYSSAEPSLVQNDGRIDLGSTSNNTFLSEIGNLPINSNINFRAFAVNEFGIGYSVNVPITLQNASVPDLSIYVNDDEIGKESFVVRGEVTNTGGFEITSHGIVWSTSNSYPSINSNDGIFQNGTLSGANFNSTVNNLSFSTLYYVRVFATNQVGTSYSESISVETLPWYEIPEGLIAYYTFDKQNSEDELNNFHGEENGVLYTTDVAQGTNGYSVSFNATQEDYIYFPSSPLSNGQSVFTLSLWIKSTSSNQGILTCATPDTWGGTWFDLRIKDSKIRGHNDVGSHTIDYDIQSYLDNSWHHFVYSFNSTNETHKLYIDGKYKGEVFRHHQPVRSKNSCVLGIALGVDPKYFNGKLDNCRFYNRELSNEEILLLFNLKQ